MPEAVEDFLALERRLHQDERPHFFFFFLESLVFLLIDVVRLASSALIQSGIDLA